MFCNDLNIEKYKRLATLAYCIIRTQLQLHVNNIPRYDSEATLSLHGDSLFVG